MTGASPKKVVFGAAIYLFSTEVSRAVSASTAALVHSDYRVPYMYLYSVPKLFEKGNYHTYDHAKCVDKL